MKIVFFGTDALSARVLQRLHPSPSMVVVPPDRMSKIHGKSVLQSCPVKLTTLSAYPNTRIVHAPIAAPKPLDHEWDASIQGDLAVVFSFGELIVLHATVF